MMKKVMGWLDKCFEVLFTVWLSFLLVYHFALGQYEVGLWVFIAILLWGLYMMKDKTSSLMMNTMSVMSDLITRQQKISDEAVKLLKNMRESTNQVKKNNRELVLNNRLLRDELFETNEILAKEVMKQKPKAKKAKKNSKKIVSSWIEKNPLE